MLELEILTVMFAMFYIIFIFMFPIYFYLSIKEKEELNYNNKKKSFLVNRFYIFSFILFLINSCQMFYSFSISNYVETNKILLVLFFIGINILRVLLFVYILGSVIYFFKNEKYYKRLKLLIFVFCFSIMFSEFAGLILPVLYYSIFFFKYNEIA